MFNRKNKWPYLIGLLIFSSDCIAQIPKLEHWREHLSYQNAIQVLLADKIYCATSTAVFSIDEKKEVQRFNKINGLHESSIACIGWDSFTRQLVIAHQNGNIDLLGEHGIRNITDIKRSPLFANKKINQLYCQRGIGYLSTEIGIILINLVKNEIKDSWQLGNNGNQIPVNAICEDGNYFYAGTSHGLKKISLTNPNPNNSNQWQSIGSNQGLEKGNINNVFIVNNRLIVQKNDSLYIQTPTGFDYLFSDPQYQILHASTSNNQILLGLVNQAGKGKILQIAESGVIEKTIFPNPSKSLPRSCLWYQNEIWVADEINGLTSFGNTPIAYIPNSPKSNPIGSMTSSQDRLLVTAGGINNQWQGLGSKKGIHFYENNEWQTFDSSNSKILDSTTDLLPIAISPMDQSIWVGSFGQGLLQIKNKTIARIPNSQGTKIAGMAFDLANILWTSNYGTSTLLAWKPDGKKVTIQIPFAVPDQAIADLLIDDLNQVWIISPKNNGLICYQYGNSLEQTTDDKWKLYQLGQGKGNLPSNQVLCLAKDKNGVIWVGTDRGIALIQCNQEIFSANSCDATLPIVQQDQFAGYLFANEIVQCIAVDGADRKWIGTKNGLWLINPDGSKIIYRFTESNSPLLNNDIRKISIVPNTGELFILTASGLCSFRSTATEGGASFNHVLVFPNPVLPNYAGKIAISGLANHAVVKITELSGRLVYQGRALGGQLVWNGLNYLNQKPAAGIYLVIARDENGTEKMVTKIILLSGKN